MKQVKMIDVVDADLTLIVKYKKSLAPHKPANKQFVVADLITKEARRVRRIMGE